MFKFYVYGHTCITKNCELIEAPSPRKAMQIFLSKHPNIIKIDFVHDEQHNVLYTNK